LLKREVNNMKAIRFAMMAVLFSCVFQSLDAIAGQVYGSSGIVYDYANNKVKGLSRTEVDYDTAAYYTPYVCGSLYKNGVEQVRACGGGIITASINTQFTGTSATGSILSDHYVDMQYFDEGASSYVDYLGYSFLPGYTYSYDWLFNSPNIFTNRQPISIRLGSTTADCNCLCTTPLSDSEWSVMSTAFPNVKRCQLCRLAAATATYNCVAWTIDDTTQWWWFQADTNGNGKVSVAEFNAFYITKGKSNIWYYGTSTSDIVHVAKKGGGNGTDCEASSKMGSDIRMAHNKTKLEGGAYGSVQGGN
jgi:hypothetical protein